MRWQAEMAAKNILRLIDAILTAGVLTGSQIRNLFSYTPFESALNKHKSTNLRERELTEFKSIEYEDLP